MTKIVDQHQKFHLLDINMTSNKIINELIKYKRVKYRFLIVNFSFSLSIRNDTIVLFTTYNRLNDAKAALINGKEHKILGVINLFQIKN